MAESCSAAALRDFHDAWLIPPSHHSGQPVSGAKVTGDCGDGLRNLGGSGVGGAVGSANDVDVAGDRTITLSLTLGNPIALGAFTPGVARDYFGSTAANVISTGGEAQLSVADSSAAPTARRSRSRCRRRCPSSPFPPPASWCP